ncbi:hypothetical protein [Anaerospora hongkongensis]|uniref:hypothetical protein n=1 Tax=Anaerospora hongkongensis TaxID=244830 RepID=UPI00289C22A0|nr:hypothetical protein [Anaerospora hongkongensis]
MNEKIVLKVSLENNKTNSVLDIYLKNEKMILEMYNRYADQQTNGAVMSVDPYEFITALQRLLGSK